MHNIEELELYRRTLQSRIAKTGVMIYNFGIPTNTAIAQEQAILKRLMGWVTKELKKCYAFERDMERYWASYDGKKDSEE